MSLIVEDGTGLANADSYISVADADTYHTDRDNTAWGEVTNKDAALRKATEYMMQAYRLRWLGTRTHSTQALDWPRNDVPMADAPGGYGSFAAMVPNDEVPVEVRRACAELALQTVNGDLNPPLDRVTSREKVGDLDVSYADDEVPYKRFRHVDQMLSPYLGAAGSITAQVVRA